MTNFYQINAQSCNHMICQLIERMAIIDHHDNNQSISWLNHNRFTALQDIHTHADVILQHTHTTTTYTYTQLYRYKINSQ